MSYSRICTRAAGLSVALALACAATLHGAEAGPSYDGLWSVVNVTKTGQYDAAYGYPIRSTTGRLVNAGSAPINISGKLGKNGAVIVNVNTGDNSAVGKGRLA